jgi:hypothetical protein
LKNVISPEQRQLVAQHIVKFWDAGPRSYEFVFPLPAFAVFDAEIEIAPGLAFRNVPQNMVDYTSMGAGVPLSTLVGGVAQPPIACLAVTGKGLMLFVNASDPAATGAIRRAKTVMQLGEVEEVLLSNDRSHT